MASNAIVIKNANFLSNKVATVVYLIPCSDIYFSTDTITLTGYSGVSVSYTIVPEDTSDPIVWASSDSDVFTVEDGVITAVGLGTATLTATCNGHVASATVTVDIQYAEYYHFTAINVINDNYCTYHSDYTRIAATATSDQVADYGISGSTSGTVVEMFYPVIIPKGTTKIKISIDPDQKSLLYNSNNCYVVFYKNASCGAAGHLDSALYMSAENDNIRTDETETYTIPSGADCYTVTLRLQSTYTSADDPATVMETLGFKIEYLTD